MRVCLYTYLLALYKRGLGSTSTIGMSTPSIQNLASKYRSPVKELLGEMADSRLEQGNQPEVIPITKLGGRAI